MFSSASRPPRTVPTTASRSAVRHQVVPHSAGRGQLEREAAIYRQGRTPIPRPAGARVNANGRTNLGPVSNGVSGEFPPMFGGTTTNTLINDPANVTLT